MASLSLLCSLSFCSPSSKPLLPTTHASFPSPSLSLKPKTLRSTTSISGSPLSLPRVLSPSRPSPTPPTVVAAKSYKMKTHKASAKRFRVTGTGKIVRRRSGKQHLLAKKNTKRKLRLSKMVTVNRSDYDNVIGCLPYLKVDRSSQ